MILEHSYSYSHRYYYSSIYCCYSNTKHHNAVHLATTPDRHAAQQSSISKAFDSEQEKRNYYVDRFNSDVIVIAYNCYNVLSSQPTPLRFIHHSNSHRHLLGYSPTFLVHQDSLLIVTSSIIISHDTNNSD